MFDILITDVRLLLDVSRPFIPSSMSDGWKTLLFHHAVQVAIPVLALALDTLIFVLLVWKTLRRAIEMRKLSQHSITQLILRDGA